MKNKNIQGIEADKYQPFLDHLHTDDNIREVRIEDTKGRKRWLGICKRCNDVVYTRPHGNTSPIKALKRLAKAMQTDPNINNDWDQTI